MGNNNSQCKCYSSNKQQCNYNTCKVKLCGKCLMEKKQNIIHSHKTMCCGSDIKLGVDKSSHNCRCYYCHSIFQQTRDDLKNSACRNCIDKHKLFKCPICLEQSPIFIDVGDSHSDRKDILCKNCIGLICSIHNGKSNEPCNSKCMFERQ